MNRFENQVDFKQMQKHHESPRLGTLKKMMAEQTEMLKQMSELMTKFINHQVIPSQNSA